MFSGSGTVQLSTTQIGVRRIAFGVRRSAFVLVLVLEKRVGLGEVLGVLRQVRMAAA